MSNTEPLGYAEGIMEQLRASYEGLSREQLLDLVCHLNKTYVLDQTIPFDLPLPERAQDLSGDPPHAPPLAEEPSGESPEQSFARLIEGLKRRTQLPQLEGFSVVGGRAVLVVDNQKVTFGERVTVEFIPRSARVGPPSPTSPAPAPSSAPRGAPPRRAPAAAAPPPKRSQEKEDDGYDASVERFRRLDLD